MDRIGRLLLIANFLIFLITGFLFTISNFRSSYTISQITGLLSILIVFFYFRSELLQDFRSPFLLLSLLISSFVVLVFFFS
ncbi:MAG: hypothetical protein QXU18_14775, partial [Thermoplasmatales archaeon]